MLNDAPLISPLDKTTAQQRCVGYLRLLSNDGRDFEGARRASGLSHIVLKKIARAEKISFSDYDPDKKQKRLVWQKAKLGWSLTADKGETACGSCVREDDAYTAFAHGVSKKMSSARAAMRHLSEELDARSVELFDAKNLCFELENSRGEAERLYP